MSVLKKPSLGARIEHISFYVPKQLVENNINQISQPKNMSKNFFLAPKTRFFAYPQESSADLGVSVVERLISETNIKPTKIDLLLFSCALNDRAKIGIGSEVRNKTGLVNACVMQVDTGCTSYISLLKTADSLLATGKYKNAILLTVTNFISRLPEFQQSSKSSVLGDGASATLVTRAHSSIFSSYEHVRGENFGLMICEPKKSLGTRKPFSDPNPGPLQIEFSRKMLRKLRDDSINQVVTNVNEAISRSGFAKKDINFFLCHQPNMNLIQEWRDKLGFDHEHSYDTFEHFGNLFQSSIPVSLAHGLKQGVIRKGDLIAAGTFSNGADFSCAMVFCV